MAVQLTPVRAPLVESNGATLAVPPPLTMPETLCESVQPRVGICKTRLPTTASNARRFRVKTPRGDVRYGATTRGVVRPVHRVKQIMSMDYH
jgi:hypothetical protein